MIMQQAVPLQAFECANFNLFECLLTEVHAMTNQWFAKGLEIAEWIFIALATLEIIATGYGAIRKNGNWGDMFQTAMIKIMSLTLVWLLIKTSEDWLGNNLLDFPVRIAAMASDDVTNPDGAPDVKYDANKAVTPSHIVVMGWKMFAAAWAQMPTGFDLITNPLKIVVVFMLMLTSLVTLFTLIMLAVELLKTIIECYIVVGGGALLLGFLAFRGTAPLAEGVLRYIIQITIKLFFLSLIAIAVSELALSVIDMLTDIGAVYDMWANFSGAVLAPGVQQGGGYCYSPPHDAHASARVRHHFFTKGRARQSRVSNHPIPHIQL